MSSDPAIAAAKKAREARAHGAFVYTGSGARQPEAAPAEQKECVKYAVAMQWCLAKRNHKEKWCTQPIEEWKACVRRVKERVEKEGK
jgi:hypothetical protein